MTIKVGIPYSIDKTTDISIWPHRDMGWAYNVTGKYYVVKDIYHKKTKCRTESIIANELTLKEARNVIKEYLSKERQ